MSILLPDLMVIVMDYLEYSDVRLCSNLNGYSWFYVLSKTKHYDNESLKNGLERMCEEGNYDFVVKSIQLGSKAFNPALIRSCLTKHIEIVKLLIRHGANDFNTALLYACQSGQVEIVKLLVKNGANDWKNGFLGACRAKQPNLEIVKLMVSKLSYLWDDKLIWTMALDILMDPEWILPDRIQLIIVAVHNGGQFSSKYQAQQQKPLVHQLVEGGIDLSILEKAMIGMQKIVRGMRHQRIYEEKRKLHKKLYAAQHAWD